MEDFEVRDVMNRYSHPLLEPIFKGRLLQQGGSGQDVWLLNITLQNQGPRRARDIKLIFYWPQEIRTTITDRYRKRIVEGEITVPNKVSVNVEHTIQSTDWIIFPEDQMRLTEDGVYRFTYFVDGEALNFVVQQTPELVWKVFADDMPPREGKVSFSHNLVDI